MKTSKIFQLKLPDWGKALIMVVMGSVVGSIYAALQVAMSTGTSLSFDWKMILYGALFAGISYIMKNFMSNSNGQILTKEVATQSVSNVPPSLVPKLKFYQHYYLEGSMNIFEMASKYDTDPTFAGIIDGLNVLPEMVIETLYNWNGTNGRSLKIIDLIERYNKDLPFKNMIDGLADKAAGIVEPEKPV